MSYPSDLTNYDWRINTNPTITDFQGINIEIPDSNTHLVFRTHNDIYGTHVISYIKDTGEGTLEIGVTNSRGISRTWFFIAYNHATYVNGAYVYDEPSDEYLLIDNITTGFRIGFWGSDWDSGIDATQKAKLLNILDTCGVFYRYPAVTQYYPSPYVGDHCITETYPSYNCQMEYCISSTRLAPEGSTWVNSTDALSLTSQTHGIKYVCFRPVGWSQLENMESIEVPFYAIPTDINIFVNGNYCQPTTYYYNEKGDVWVPTYYRPIIYKNL